MLQQSYIIAIIVVVMVLVSVLVAFGFYSSLHGKRSVRREIVWNCFTLLGIWSAFVEARSVSLLFILIKMKSFRRPEVSKTRKTFGTGDRSTGKIIRCATSSTTNLQGQLEICSRNGWTRCEYNPNSLQSHICSPQLMAERLFSQGISHSLPAGVKVTIDHRFTACLSAPCQEMG